MKQKPRSNGLKIHTLVLNRHDFRYFEYCIKNIDEGLVVINENSMIDIDRIDKFDKGKLFHQSANPYPNMDNENILDLINLMLSKKKCTFFPGTYMGHFGGFFLPTMPIIQEGQLVDERVKQTSIAYVDNYAELAENLIGKDYAERVKTQNIGDLSVEPMKTLCATLGEKVDFLKKDSFKSIDIYGLNVLPVICNELSLVGEEYNGDGLDVIVHSSSNLFKDDEEMFESYLKILNKLKKRDKLKKSVMIAISEKRELDSYSGILVYERGKLKEVNML